MRQIGPGNDADKLITAQNGEALDIVLLEQHDALFERCILCDRNWVRCHDLSDLATPFAHEFGRNLTRTRQKPQPPAPLAFRPDCGAANKVTFRYDADQSTG